MKINIKQISFVVLGLVIITALFAISRLNIATAAKKDGKQFDDWVVTCTPENEKAKSPEVCLLTQRLNLNQEDKQQLLALFQIGYFGKEKELKIIQTLPLGVRLEAGTSIISSKKLIAPGKYTTCTQAGCQAVATITDTDLKTLTSTQENSVAFMNLEGKQLSLPISIKGLEKGLQYIK
ncbi:MAG: invasion associated locus B family protein [Rickettsiaceae bacterium]|nr:invasion associated locus B family protein [Rickettsiaceae bacterium]